MIPFLFIGNIITAQKSDTSLYIVVENIPKYNNGDYQNFRYEIEKSLQFPEYAINHHLYGRVFVHFTVDDNQPREKRVNNIYVVKGVHPSLDFVAVQLVSEAPDLWDCRLPRGKMKAVSFTFPVNFKIENFDSSKITTKYNQTIEKLLEMDSLKLDSMLYKSWPLPPYVKEKDVKPAVKPRPEPWPPCEQIYTVSGKIMDENLEPFPFVNIVIVGTSTGTITNYDGTFELKVPCNREIEITFLDYYPLKYGIDRDMTDMKIRMKPAYREMYETTK